MTPSPSAQRLRLSAPQAAQTSARRFGTRSLAVLLTCCVALSGMPRAGAQEQSVEDAPAPEAFLGVVTEKPAEQPYVEVDGVFLVPYTERIPGTDLTFEMVPIPGGTVSMGSPEDEEGHKEDEGPRVQVQVGPMWVAKEEVSWAEYRQYMNLYATFKEFEARNMRPVTDDNRADAVTAPTELYDPSFTFEYGEDDEQPAVTMTQYAAQQYTKWLSRITGRQYRLPTEAEWEHAARGGTTTAYSWGDDPEMADEYAWYFDNAFEGPVAGGQKKPNPFGLYDMHGNVAEWTVEAYSEDGYSHLPTDEAVTVEEAVRWPQKSSPAVARGGSWEMELPELRSASRLASDDELWKSEDPNFPLSPWWFTSDPARGVGMRLFRSYPPKSEEEIRRYWEINSDDVRRAVESRISGGRGVLGLVDEELPAAVQVLEQ